MVGAVSPRIDISMTAEELSAFFEAGHTAMLASNGRDGFPHCVAMWYVPRAGEVAMWTYAKSQKACNLERDPRCSFLLESGRGYSELRGVLVKGEARLLYDFEEIAAIGRELYDRYTLPVTGIPVDQGPEVEILRQAHKRIGMVLSLDKVASWDHSKMGRHT